MERNKALLVSLLFGVAFILCSTAFLPAFSGNTNNPLTEVLLVDEEFNTQEVESLKLLGVEDMEAEDKCNGIKSRRLLQWNADYETGPNNAHNPGSRHH